LLRDGPVAADEKHPRTALYKSFDPEKTTQKYAKLFSETTSSGTSEIGLGPLPEVFRISYITGTLSDDGLKAVLTDLQAEFVALAKTSGVKAAEPKSTVGDRPIALLMPPLIEASDTGEINMNTLKGFYITYEAGAIDVFAHKRVGGDKTEWRIVCLVHEKK
jgi:hypothetical protein